MSNEINRQYNRRARRGSGTSWRPNRHPAPWQLSLLRPRLSPCVFRNTDEKRTSVDDACDALLGECEETCQKLEADLFVLTKICALKTLALVKAAMGQGMPGIQICNNNWRLPLETRLWWVMQKVKRALCLTSSDWGYLTRATVELIAARVRLFTEATDRVLQELQAPLSTISQKQGSSLATIDVDRLSWAIAVAAKHVPWRSDCLIQVVAAHRWMRRYHLRPDFYLGVTKADDGVFAAHAWLRYGDLTVTGGNYDRFSVLIEPAADTDV
jgi:hypothetical protein